MTAIKLNPSNRCSLVSSRRTVLRGCLKQLREIQIQIKGVAASIEKRWSESSSLGKKIKLIQEREDKSLVYVM
jgi:hypothetical protein